MSLGDLSLACASLLVDELFRGGVRHACVSPGSRSTPIALALSRHPAIAVHVHLDERSGAFFALGIAKGTGQPVALACTSGTAAAEFLPAVVEASQSRVPLVVLTADRPPRLRGTGANQTIDQPGLYGSFARVSLEAPLPRPGDGAVWRQLGAHSIRAATGYPNGFPPGPAHLNLPFDEPLTPDGEDFGGSVDDPGPLMNVEPPPAGASRTESSGDDAAALAGLLASTERGAIVIGSSPVPPRSLVAAAEQTGWPVLAEPISGVRARSVLAAGQALIGDASFAERARPEVVIQAGAAPTARATQAFVASANDAVVIDAFHLDPDPDRRASLHVRADPELVAAAMDEPVRRKGSPWLTAWRAADERARSALDRTLDGIDDPFEPRIARDVAAWAPTGSTMFVGNSTPVRDLDLAMGPRKGVRFLANRGASGIDGLASTALGVARSSPTVALIGDLSFLYDAGALLWAGGSEPDIVLVVLRNGGGEVFSQLPQRDLPEHHWLFTTPHDVDIGAVCAAARVGHARVDRAPHLVAALDDAARAGGIHVVEVTVDPERGLALRRQLREAIAEALTDAFIEA